ncbi:Protein of unknown function (DUF2922) [Desulfosporosinus acidiphilus SJ4]|uniref:DUF2922 domain-containing protein n=1 Tax=Desulfosporosinus acidiphilus (strain DSM 22704 / JCM 16185 / SJ4) TaxID=646529 RepID=I4D0V8_DESAJ|nr:DUF2922 domain-containing protein [Desulfosporosinus acidiphilus]AFM39432.1 Protein of unknown function (DUF2922) [Desulfosporosinus acidiphilus SJ4]
MTSEGPLDFNSFTTAGGKTFAITIPDPREDVDKAQAEAVMDTIIRKNVFLTPSGELIGKRDIKIVGTTTNDLYDPPQA